MHRNYNNNNNIKYIIDSILHCNLIPGIISNKLYCFGNKGGELGTEISK